MLLKRGFRCTSVLYVNMKVIRFPLIVLLICFASYAQGQSFSKFMNTEDGFCEYRDQKIPIGELFYDDVACEKYICEDGILTGWGCPYPMIHIDYAHCQLANGEGSFPDCCPRLRCD